MRTKGQPVFGGFHVHLGVGSLGCEGPRAEIPALEHEYLVREAERLGCSWLASMRCSHPLCMSGTNMFGWVLAEVDRLLGDSTVDDRARAAALWIRALRGSVGAEANTVTACGVGDGSYEGPRRDV